jgi:hypothetical protein
MIAPKLHNSFLFLFLLCLLIGCKSDDDNGEVIVDPVDPLTVSNFLITIDENPNNGQLVGTIDATATSGSITFNLRDQNPKDALEINQETGAVIVADAFYFNYEIHTTITGNVDVQNGDLIEEVSITININDVAEDIVNIWDPNFKYALVNYNVVDLNNDGYGDVPVDQNNDLEIQVSEAAAVDNLYIEELSSIESLRGIESFTNLQELYCRETGVTNIDQDLRYNQELLKLSCWEIPDPELDFSNNSSLQYLGCGGNDLERINVSQNIDLRQLSIGGFSLSSIDVSQNINLDRLGISNTYLNSIDVSQNTLLERFGLSNTRIAEVDLRQNPNLESISCSWNYLLARIDLGVHLNLDFISCNQTKVAEIDVSQCPNLTRLHISYALLTELDVSNNPNLWSLNCDRNYLTSLNLKNGNNLGLETLLARDMPSLTCIQVDDVTIANSKPNWYKDATANYSEECL